MKLYESQVTLTVTQDGTMPDALADEILRELSGRMKRFANEFEQWTRTRVANMAVARLKDVTFDYDDPADGITPPTTPPQPSITADTPAWQPENWLPLERAMDLLGRKREECSAFMFMGEEAGVFQYKHRATRKYACLFADSTVEHASEQLRKAESR